MNTTFYKIQFRQSFLEHSVLHYTESLKPKDAKSYNYTHFISVVLYIYTILSTTDIPSCTVSNTHLLLSHQLLFLFQISSPGDTFPSTRAGQQFRHPLSPKSTKLQLEQISQKSIDHGHIHHFFAIYVEQIFKQASQEQN